MELPTGFETTEVEARCGRVVTCSYLEHKSFKHDSNLCQSLHYVFTQYCVNVVHTSVYLLRSAIISFLDYTTGHNESTPDALKITHYNDISTEVFTGFISYLNKNKLPVSYADKMKSATTIVAQNTGKLPLLMLPSVKVKSDKPTEPLHDSAYNELTEALKKHIQTLQNKLTLRAELDTVEPYEFDKLYNELYPSFDRGDVFRWYQYTIWTEAKSNRESYEAKFKASGDKELIALCGTKTMAKEFRKIYERDSAPYLLTTPSNPFYVPGINNWVPDSIRVLRTLIDHGYPFSHTLDEMESNHNKKILFNLHQSCDDIIKLLIYKYTWGSYQSKVSIPAWDDVLAMYYPTPMDMTAIVVFIMLQSGWNREVVLAIDPDNFEHVLTGAISESMRVIFSEKNKSQGLNTPYEDPKQITANSDKDNPYSIYNLIILAKKLSEPLVDHDFDVIADLKDWDEMSKLFLCLRGWGEWQGLGGRHTSISNPKAYMTAIKAFLQRYPIYENGRRLTVGGDLGRRLRPTWKKYYQKTSPLSLLTLQMGHADEQTTDIYYDSSGDAMQDRRLRLRSALEEVVELLRTRQFQGLLGKQASQLANEKPKMFHIPGMERPLWGCRNQYAPSWPGAERQIGRDQKCTAIDKCLGCDKVWITEDSLPYLFERLHHIEEDLADSDENSFSTRLTSEKEIIEYLIDSWNDDDAIKVAARYQRRHSPMLPRDLASLRLIFQEESLHEYL